MSSMQRLVVIGNGMAGARLVEEILARDRARFRISVFGEEPHGNYNRILLSGVLAGTHQPGDIVINSLEWYAQHGVTLHAGVRAGHIDLHARTVHGSGGVCEPYDVLVLATGSRPALPPIDGLVHDNGKLLRGAFVFRTVDDCGRIRAAAAQAKAAIVIGGGLLGVEAARGLLNHGVEVHLVHLMRHLMDAQLDREAGRILQKQLELLGLHVLTGRTTTAIVGSERVEGVRFSDGTTLPGDMVVVAAGITPNVQLAKDAGLQVGRGVIVGDDLACIGQQGVYAIGECAEHRGRLYGLVAPLWEQAEVLAGRLTGRSSAFYVGSATSTKLKVAGIDVAVMGTKDPVEDDDEVVSYSEATRGVYKKLVIRDNRIAGAILIGDPGVVPGITQAFTSHRPLTPHRSELLFPYPAAIPAPAPELLPDTAQVCDCNAVSKAQIVDAVLRGARSFQAVSDATRACTGCGSCRPEVERIIELASRGVESPDLLVSPAAPALPAPPAEEAQVVTLNKIEKLKQERDGLDILPETPALARAGWQAIGDGDRERLKWLGVFFRRQTPGKFMMRLRMSNGFGTADQIRAIADVSEEFGTGVVDITTRQQIQIRGFEIEHLEEIWRRLDGVGLTSLQTGMDNVRNVIGCAVAGLSARELFDASPVVQAFTEMFLRNKAFTNLPRKFNVGISGCTEHCTHAESQDLALTPAVKKVGNVDRLGFNVVVGGKMGSGGCRIASPLDIFVDREDAAALCREIVLVFRDHGLRGQRTRARLSFLLESWGVDRFRREIESRWGRPLEKAGRDARTARGADHLGVHAQKQKGLNYAGLLVPVGRIRAELLRAAARASDEYGTGDIRVTTGQNLIIPNVPDSKLQALISDPLLRELSPDPPGAARGLVACTGIDYCHFALIETKTLAVNTAEYLSTRFAHERRFTTHWSGCPAGCGNHALADIGLMGKNVRVNGEIIEAVDVFVGGRAGPDPRVGVKVLEDVPCDQLPQVLEQLVPYISGLKRNQPAAAASRTGPVANDSRASLNANV